MTSLRMKSFWSCAHLFIIMGTLLFQHQAEFTTWAFQQQRTSSSQRHSNERISGSGVAGFKSPKENDIRLLRSSASKLHYAKPSVVVQGSSLQVFQFATSRNSRSLRIDMMTDGRPMEARAELWQGPDYCPQKMRVYSENGYTRPFRVCMEAPANAEFSVAVRNTGKTFEFPLTTSVQDVNEMDEVDANPFYYSELLMDDEEDDETNGYGNVLSRSNGRTIQGGAMRSFQFAPKVEKIQVLLETIGGLPLCARIEISQGPDNNKQVMDVYSEDGQRFPLYLAIDLPSSSSISHKNGIIEMKSTSTDGLGHVMRIINASSMEYPIRVWVDSYKNDSSSQRVVKPQRILKAKGEEEVIPRSRVPQVGDYRNYPTW